MKSVRQSSKAQQKRSSAEKRTGKKVTLSHLHFRFIFLSVLGPEAVSYSTRTVRVKNFLEGAQRQEK